MNPLNEYVRLETRRQFFAKGALGLGAAALSSLLNTDAAANQIANQKTNQSTQKNISNAGLPSLPHFAPKAKRAIYLFMSGAPSQLDTFDYKPKMAEWFDKDLPDSIRKGQRLTTMTSGQKRFPIAP